MRTFNKFQLCEKHIYIENKTKLHSDNFHAGGKAPSDVSQIALKNGYKTIFVRNIIGKGIKYHILRKLLVFDWIKIIFKIKRKSILLIQFPIRWGNLHLKNISFFFLHNIKKVNIIGLIHDIEPLRHQLSKNDNSKPTKEYKQMLKYSDYLVAHNSKMREYLINENFPENRIFELGIFDYLCDDINRKTKLNKEIIFAGNLSQTKSPFIAKFSNLTSLNFNLYGINFDKESITSNNIKYSGSYTSDILPQKIENGFGLIWDGEDLDSCTGNMGNYLRWNNPHKLSLYIVSEIPVIIWAQAAEANFVKENHIGFTINNISEIKEIFDHITDDEYNLLIKNLHALSEKLRKGFFIENVLYQIESKVM